MSRKLKGLTVLEISGLAKRVSQVSIVPRNPNERIEEYSGGADGFTFRVTYNINSPEEEQYFVIVESQGKWTGETNDYAVGKTIFTRFKEKEKRKSYEIRRKAREKASKILSGKN
jgi:hypothetical protein